MPAIRRTRQLAQGYRFMGANISGPAIAQSPPVTHARTHIQTGPRTRLGRLLNTVPAFVNFAIGGGVIAVIGAVILELLVRAGENPRLAQAVQLTLTLVLNFAYSYLITWRDRPRAGLPRQIAWFVITRGATQLASWFAFSSLVALGMRYQLANGTCLCGATAVNYFTSDRLVFRTRGRHSVRRSRRVLIATSVAAGLAGAWYVLRVPVLPTILLSLAAFNLGVGGMEARWRLYGWRTPDAAGRMSWPAPVRPGSERMTFSLIVPVRDEASVIGDTLRRLLKQTHAGFQIIVSLCDDDEPTIAAVRRAIWGNPRASRITTVIGRYEKSSKARKLNHALRFCTGDITGVIDAEDDVAEDLLVHAEALFEKSGADVVQGGVQLMNLGRGLGKWFQVHNVLEYFWRLAAEPYRRLRAGRAARHRVRREGRHGIQPGTHYARGVPSLHIQQGGWFPFLAAGPLGPWLPGRIHVG